MNKVTLLINSIQPIFIKIKKHLSANHLGPFQYYYCFSRKCSKGLVGNGQDPYCWEAKNSCFPFKRTLCDSSKQAIGPKVLAGISYSREPMQHYLNVIK